MKIAYVTAYFEPWLGYESPYLPLELQKLGNEVHIITSNRCKGLKKKSLGPSILHTKGGYLVHRLSSFFEYNSVIFVTKMKKTLQMIRPDIVHVRGILSVTPMIPIFYAKSLRYAVVAGVLSGPFSPNPPEKVAYGFFKRCLLPYIKKNVDKWFAPSKGYCRWLSREFGVDEVELIPIGADVNFFRRNEKNRESIRHSLNIKDDDILIINCGSIVPRKKLELLIRAATPLIRRYKKVKILLVGDGQKLYINKLLELAQRNRVASNIIFSSRVNREKLPGFYSAADIGVWPGFPSIGIIEAMASALPIVIPRSDHTDHYLEYQNGFSFNEDEFVELTNCLQTLIQNEKLRKRMGRRSRELVEEKLNWSSIAKRYIEVFKSAIESNERINPIV